MKQRVLLGVCTALLITGGAVAAVTRGKRPAVPAVPVAVRATVANPPSPVSATKHRRTKRKLPVTPRVTVTPAPIPTAIPRPIPPQTSAPTTPPEQVSVQQPTNTPAPAIRPAPVPLVQAPPPATSAGGFTPIDDQAWDETAVRKVLHTFAFGGQTSDAQIRAWADMSPQAAIAEMLRLDEHNGKLSTPATKDYDNLSNTPNTLKNLTRVWGSDDASNQMPPDRRWLYASTSWVSPSMVWLQAAMSRGLNPFRDRIGYWETNYHMAVTMEGGAVHPQQIVRYYDGILDALARNAPYEEVISLAASSAAVARQYGHDRNVWWGNSCLCNEDFARELHQLFFGVLGNNDHAYHEQVSIKNTALVLTDFRLSNTENPGAPWAGAEVAYGTENHYNPPVEILGQTISGANAREEIAALARYEINHPESLRNLPVTIVRDLADDNLNPEKSAVIRGAWQSMAQKNLLSFIRDYAISTTFHSPDRIKYKTSIDRHLTLNNLATQSNEEAYLDIPDIWRLTWEEQENAFTPDNGVFGGQTGPEALNNSNLFRINYNAMATGTRFVRPDIAAYGRNFSKDWSTTVPRDTNGNYSVAKTGEWLWQRLIADGLKNFGPLERAYVYALLATGQDFDTLIHPDRPETSPSLAEVQSPAGQALIADLANRTIKLDSADADQRTKANSRIGQALSFIAGTPYIFAQEGR